MPNRFRTMLPAIASAAAALIAYVITLRGTYIFDDASIFVVDDRLRHVNQWWRFWTESYNGSIDNLYRPLVSMTYAIQWLMHGDGAAWPYHFVNWLLHAAVSALVAELARRLISSRAAWFTGILFAIHPVHVDAVAYIVGRAELMCALGFFGAIVLLLHRPLTRGRAVAIAGCFIFSLLSKEQGMLLPAMVLATGYFIGIRARNPTDRTGVITLVIFICWSMAGYILFRERFLKFEWDRSFLDWTINPLIRSVGSDRWLVPITILGRYTALLICPIKLSIDYGGNVIGSTARWNEPWIYIGFIAVIAWVTWLCVAAVQRRRAMIIALIGLGLTYGVVSNFYVLIGTNFGERLMYLPSAFLLIALAAVIERLPLRVFSTALIALALAGSIRTISYASQWNNRLQFYEFSTREQPESIRLHMLLVSELRTRGQLNFAAEEAASARTILPEFDDVWYQSAEIAIRQRRFNDAAAFIARAMKINPSMKGEMWNDELRKVRDNPAAAPTALPIFPDR